MASIVQTGSVYYCHSCQSRKAMIVNYKCPTCNTGFIEEIVPRQVQQAPCNEGRRANTVPTNEPPAQHNAVLQWRVSSLANLRLERGNNQEISHVHVPHSPVNDALYREIWRHISMDEREQTRGLTDQEISGFPSRRIGSNNADLNSPCSICLDNLKLNEEIFQLSCDHTFHKPCMTIWLKNSATCPVCRKTVGPPQFESFDFVPRMFPVPLDYFHTTNEGFRSPNENQGGNRPTVPGPRPLNSSGPNPVPHIHVATLLGHGTESNIAWNWQADPLIAAGMNHPIQEVVQVRRFPSPSEIIVIDSDNSQSSDNMNVDTD